MEKTTNDQVAKFFISALGLIAIFIVLKELQHIFIPFVLAYFLFFVFQPFNNFCIKKRIPYGITIAIDLIIVIIFLWGLSKIIIVSFEEFNSAFPVYEDRLNNIIYSTAKSFGITESTVSNFNLLIYLRETLDVGGLAGGFFSSTLSFFSIVFFVLFFYIFISTGHNKVIEAFKARFAEEEESTDIEHKTPSYLERTIQDIPEKIQKYIVTKFFMSLLTSLSVGLILWLFDVDFWVVWMVLTFLFNFIPNIGSVLAVIFPFLIALIQFQSFGYAILIGGLLALIQNIYGSILEPKIMGDKLGLNPLVILLSLLLWGYVWGLVGMFLSVPITAVIKILISESKSENLKLLNNLMG
ncbi:MAG: AI-2E family transporter [Bacteroidetes bacterium]|nr:AI-2E family transporter [Bacteroidota bacterium]